MEKLRVDIISALNYVGVNCPSNTSFHDLPDYILKIGGTDTSNWPINLSSIGYNAEDCRRASYRYMLGHLYDHDSYSKSYLNLSNLITMAIRDELPKSIEKANYWNSLTAEQQSTLTGLFNNWDGAFCPYIDTTNATDMESWFNNASKLVHVPVLNTVNVTNVHGLFAWNTRWLREFPEFDLRSVTTCESIYYDSHGTAYICGLKNLGRDPSTGTIHNMGSVYATLMFFGYDAAKWCYPVNGGILVYPMWFRKPSRGGITTDWGANIISCDALYELDTNFRISGNDISYNSLYNIITSVADVTYDSDVTWTPTITVNRELHENTDVWDPAFDSMLQAKGWAVNIIN